MIDDYTKLIFINKEVLQVKILFITHYSSLYGANLSLLEMMKKLRKNYDIEPIVLMSTGGDLVQELEKANIKYFIHKWYKWVHKKDSLELKHLIKDGLNRINYYSIYRKLNRLEFDLIHSNSSVINIGGYLSQKFNKPHIWHIREYGEEDYNYIYNRGIEKAGNYLNKYSDKIIAISNSIKRKYSDYIPKKNIDVVYNGVSFEKYNYKRDFSDIDDNRIIKFIFVGLISENKNQFEALKAAKVLKNEFGINNFKIYFAGTGKKEYINQLKMFSNKRGLEDNIDFLGYVSNMKNLREKTDIGLICSKKEAFGRVTVESMLSQMPVIGTKSGGTMEIVDHGETGCLYELGNHKQLAKYMKKIINNKSLIEKFSKKGYKKAKNNFTAEINARKIYSKYLEVLEGRK
jgi:glycosyltransferase involved in cell wall biosynthesis